MPSQKSSLSGPEIVQPQQALGPRTTNPLLPSGALEANFGDDFDPQLEAEIDEFYRTVLPEEDGAVTNSEEEWKDDGEGLVRVNWSEKNSENLLAYFGLPVHH